MSERLPDGRVASPYVQAVENERILSFDDFLFLKEAYFAGEGANSAGWEKMHEHFSSLMYKHGRRRTIAAINYLRRQAGLSPDCPETPFGGLATDPSE